MSKINKRLRSFRRSPTCPTRRHELAEEASIAAAAEAGRIVAEEVCSEKYLNKFINTNFPLRA